MNIREASPTHRGIDHRIETKRPRQKKRHSGLVLLILIIIAGSLSWLFVGISHASTLGSPVKSGWSGYCLDDYKSRLVNDNQVDLWPCNNSSAQDWQVSLTQIVHADNYCLTADTDTKITIQTCNGGADQVWLRDDTGLINPDKSKCLSAENSGEDQALSLTPCNDLTASAQKWDPNIDYSTYPCTGTQGQIVACNAIKEWITWSSEPNNHQALLGQYTGGPAYSYEEWCADFVSYVYKEAGYPFTNGNYEGWDENLAPDIINQGFTVQQSKNYVPQAGDVGYFDYPGGHVEIVVVGGKTPTFIYGNSDTIDPTTGNGEMGANTILSDPNEGGSIQYYMSPNSST